MDLAALGLSVRSDEVRKANDELGKMPGAAKRAETAAQGFGTRATGAAKQVAAANDNAVKSAQMLGNAYTRLASIISGVLTGAIAAFSLRSFIASTVEADKVQAQLAAALRSTGGVAGQTVASLNNHAAALQRITNFGDETINGAQALLLTFTKIQGDVFPKATEAILDMATAMKMDLNSAAMMVGRALNDPVLGMTALTRSGIQFTQAQKDAVKQMVETGNVAGAQAIILKELETQFGGSAKAARDTLGGALSALKNAWGDLFELGKNASEPLRRALEALIKAISDPAFVSFVQTIGAALMGAFTLAVQGATLLVNVISTLTNNIDTLGVAIGTAGGMLLAFFAPAILSGIAAGLVAIGAAGVAAIRAITVAMMANPLGALLVGITAAVTALYYFRDEVQKAIGVDVVQIARTAANYVINSFVAAYEDLRFIFSNLGNIVGAAVMGAANAVIAGVERMVQQVAAMIDGLITGINWAFSKLPGNIELGTIGNINFGRLNNSAATQLEAAARDREAAIQSIMATDRFGGAKSEFEGATPAAQNFAAAIGDVNSQLGATGGAGAKAAKAAKEVADAAAEAAKKVAEFTKGLITGFMSDMRSSLRQGKGFWESFGNAAMNVLDKITDKLLNNVLDALLKVNQAGGGGGGILGTVIAAVGRVAGFARGGYTGDGPATAAAGVVHGQEYVFSAAATRKIGVDNLEAMHKAAKGYQSGGYVTPVAHQPATGFRANDNRPAVAPVVVTIVNNAGASVEASDRTGADGSRELEIFVDKMVANSISRGSGRRVLEKQFGMSGARGR